MYQKPNGSPLRNKCQFDYPYFCGQCDYCRLLYSKEYCPYIQKEKLNMVMCKKPSYIFLAFFYNQGIHISQSRSWHGFFLESKCVLFSWDCLFLTLRERGVMVGWHRPLNCCQLSTSSIEAFQRTHRYQPVIYTLMQLIASWLIDFQGLGGYMN